MSSPVDVLAMAAHPDDVEQTCAGTLIGMAEQGYRTGVLDLTAGEMGTRGSADERAAEAAAAAREMLLAERQQPSPARREAGKHARSAAGDRSEDPGPAAAGGDPPLLAGPLSRSLSVLAVRIRGVFPGGFRRSGHLWATMGVFPSTRASAFTGQSRARQGAGPSLRRTHGLSLAFQAQLLAHAHPCPIRSRERKRAAMVLTARPKQ